MSNAITVTLPDGKELALDANATVFDVASEIGPGLAKAALAGRIDGELVDLRRPLGADCSLSIVTSKDELGGSIIRHSAEHVMADAVKRLFPNAQVDAGRTDHSEKFQYDFLVDEPFTPEDLERIEKEMNNILSEGAVFDREVMTRDQAEELFRGLGEELKLSRLGDIPADAEITIFRHGQFADLCRGPHVHNTKQIGAVKLTEASGTYFVATRLARSCSGSTARPSKARRRLRAI
jgi:threonyl-tRNA synthetase